MTLLLALLVAAALAFDGTVLVLSDLHYDPFYTATSNSRLFCRSFSHLESSSEGMFGRYGCDTPISLLTGLLNAAQTIIPNPDFLLMGGDYPAHDIYREDRHTEATSTCVSEVLNRFPASIPGLPTIGNNDVFPDYAIPAEEANDQLLKLKSIFDPWLNAIGSAAVSTFTKGGYYSYAVDGLRVLVLNTLYYSPKWTAAAAYHGLAASADDPVDQFAWLEAELEEAYGNGELVWICGHIPPGVNSYDGVETWTDNYTNMFLDLVGTYEDIIVQMYWGHYHHDEIKLVSALNNTVIPSFVLPSFSLSNNNNPGFIVATVEGSRVTDYTVYYADIMLSNLEGALMLDELYTYSEVYGAQVSGTSGSEIVEEMVDDALFFAEYDVRQTLAYASGRVDTICASYVRDTDEFSSCVENLDVE